MGCPATTPIKRYNELDLSLSLNRSNQYVEACNELSFFLRRAYSRSPKPLQSLIFEDVLSAFRLLPQMQTQKAMVVANVLLQSAESALPKQKKVLAVSEFKHAMVACKRRGKAQQEEGPPSLPEDVLILIFSFLDLRSLASAAVVCRSWSMTARENYLWELLYFSFFDDPEKGMRVDKLKSCGMMKYEKDIHSQMNMVNWRDNFKRAYNRLSSKKSTPYRGYCRSCDLIVWLDDARCYNRHSKENCGKPEIIPVSTFQIVDYVLYDSLPAESSSESDSDSDDGSIFKLWANFRCNIPQDCKCSVNLHPEGRNHTHDNVFWKNHFWYLRRRLVYESGCI